ncbi:SMI1/KNR4 family protein [Nocardia sp. NPDC048505]|uniref:DUF6630 family protein n=1 Tax=unclassified Nocardia TaxID=2637762 RepID=UPI003411113B
MFRLDGEVHVSCGQIYVESDPSDNGRLMHEAFAGQNSGLCGAAVPGALFLHTGLHSGDVGFTVEVRGQAPALAPAWEDVVEVSFYPLSDQSLLVQWPGEDSWELELKEGLDYRVRYCAQGMDQAREKAVRLDDEPLQDRYLLQFWPAPPEPDRIVRQTSQTAAYWHENARRQSDAEHRARSIMAQRRAQLTPEGTESFPSTEFPRGTADIAVISREADLQSVREQLSALSSYPAALSWDWVTTFVRSAGDRVGYIEAFLEQIGEHAFALGTVLASLDSGYDYYLAFVTPTEFEQLSQLLTAHRMSAESMRSGRDDRRMHVSPVEESWRRIDSWLAAHAPRTFASLRPPATREAISAAATELGVEFPADLVAYLRHHDGVSPGARGFVSPEEGGFSFPGFEPYTLAQILSAGLRRQESWVEYEDDPLMEGFWHHDFVPFARDISADGLFVDCRRGESFGAVGWQREADTVSFGDWGSLAAFLEQIAESLEGGTVITVGLSYVPVVDDGMLLWERALEPRVEPRSLFDLALTDPVIEPARTSSEATPNKTWPSGYDNFCLTYAQDLDETELLRRFGALPQTRRPRRREEAATIPDKPRDPRVVLPVIRVGTHGGWAFGIEEGRHLFEGTREEVLRRVSAGTRVVSVGYRDDATTSVSLFDNGELVTKYDTRSVAPPGARDPFEVFPGLPAPVAEPAPEQGQERLLAVCESVVRRYGIALPPPGLDGELDSARILPLLPDNNFGYAEDNFRIPVPERFAALVEAASPERLRRVIAAQMSSLAAETRLDTYDEVTAALALLSEEDHPGMTDNSALDLTLRRVHAEAQVTYAEWKDRSVWQDRAMAARALADVLNLSAREAMGLVVGLRQDPHWRQQLRKQLTDD